MFPILRAYRSPIVGAALLVGLAALLYFTGFGLRPPHGAPSPPELPAIAPPPATPPSEKPPEGTAPSSRFIAPYQGELITLLNPDPVVVAQIPEVRLKKFESDLSELARRVSEDPSRLEDWLSIGFIKKFFNNYSGARDAWEYAKIVDPDDARVWYNLGVLYASYVNQPALAETNFKEAIRLDSLQSGYATALADFYRYRNPSKLAPAVRVVRDAISKLPHDPTLSSYLAGLYAQAGDTARAIAEYERAFALLGSSDAALRSAIESALARLRQ